MTSSTIASCVNKIFYHITSKKGLQVKFPQRQRVGSYWLYECRYFIVRYIWLLSFVYICIFNVPTQQNVNLSIKRNCLEFLFYLDIMWLSKLFPNDRGKKKVFFTNIIFNQHKKMSK